MDRSSSSSGLSSEGGSNQSVWETRKVVVTTVVGIALISTLGSAVINGISALLNGQIATASNYASFVSGLATMVLVGVTGWYTYVTRQLVNESRRTRVQEQERAEQQYKQELESLRKSFLYEVESLNGLEKIKNKGESYAVYRNLAPVQVYQNNADKLGKLTEKEIKTLTNYYGQIDHLKDMFFAVREGKYDWEEIEEPTIEIVDNIIESQEKSIQAIEENLQESE